MMIETSAGSSVNRDYIIAYICSLTDRCFKILPMREENDESLHTYIDNFLIELISFGNLFPIAKSNGFYVQLLCIINYLSSNMYTADNEPNIDFKIVRRKVFDAISLCNKIKDSFVGGDDCT